MYTYNIAVVYFCVHHFLIGTLDKPAIPSDWRRHNIYFSLFLFVSPQGSRVLLNSIRSEAASPPEKDGRLFKTCYFFICFFAGHFSFPASGSESVSLFLYTVQSGSTVLLLCVVFGRYNLSSVQVFLFALRSHLIIAPIRTIC